MIIFEGLMPLILACIDSCCHQPPAPYVLQWTSLAETAFIYERRGCKEQDYLPK